MKNPETAPTNAPIIPANIKIPRFYFAQM